MYGQLPSYVKANATTYDVMVMDVMLSWEQEKERRASGQPAAPKLTQEEMQSMIANVKKRANNGKGNRQSKKIAKSS